MKKHYYSHAVRVLHAIWKDCMTEDDRKWAYWGNRKLFVMMWAGWNPYGQVFTWKFDWITEQLKISHKENKSLRQ